ncbi:MAG: hypothetical protein RLZZ484_1099 [Pseudomonadota bacterium]
MYAIVNALGFQAGWWACVLGVVHGYETAALLFCGLLVLAHLAWVGHARQEIQLAAVALLLGIAVDTLLQSFAVIHFEGRAWGWLSPFWLWMLWVLFALTLNSSMAFLKRLPLLISAAAGLVFGPLSYLAGAALGAASLHRSLFELSTLALAWMLALPVLVWMAQKISTDTKVAHDEP